MPRRRVCKDSGARRPLRLIRLHRRHLVCVEAARGFNLHHISAHPGRETDTCVIRERFRRLAERRTSRAIIAIRSVKRLSNPAAYEYTDEEVRAIVRELGNEITSLKEAFGRDKPTAFKLPRR